MRDNNTPSPNSLEASNASGAKDSKQNERVELNPMARQMAEQYARDTLSPTMVSGVIRLVEFGIVFLTGVFSFAYYVSFNTPHLLYYFLIMAAGGGLYVLSMEINTAIRSIFCVAPAAI